MTASISSVLHINNPELREGRRIFMPNHTKDSSNNIFQEILNQKSESIQPSVKKIIQSNYGHLSKDSANLTQSTQAKKENILTGEPDEMKKEKQDIQSSTIPGPIPENVNDLSRQDEILDHIEGTEGKNVSKEEYEDSSIGEMFPSQIHDGSILSFHSETTKESSFNSEENALIEKEKDMELASQVSTQNITHQVLMEEMSLAPFVDSYPETSYTETLPSSTKDDGILSLQEAPESASLTEAFLKEEDVLKKVETEEFPDLFEASNEGMEDFFERMEKISSNQNIQGTEKTVLSDTIKEAASSVFVQETFDPASRQKDFSSTYAQGNNFFAQSEQYGDLGGTGSFDIAKTFHTSPSRMEGPLRSYMSGTSVTQQITFTLQQMQNQELNRIKLHLNPAELGAVYIRMELSRDGKIRAHFSAEKEDTLDLLKQDPKSLEASLKESGINLNLEDLSFSLFDRDASGASLVQDVLKEKIEQTETTPLSKENISIEPTF